MRNKTPDRVADHDLQVDTVLGGPEDYQFVTSHRSMRFVLVIKRPEAELDGHIITQWFQKLEETEEDDDHMVHQRCIEDVQEQLLLTCKDMIYSLSKRITSRGPVSLQDHLFPTTVFLEIVLRNGTLRPSIMRNSDGYTSMHEPTYLDLDLSRMSDISLISANHLQYIGDLYIGQILQVSRAGHVYTFKSAHEGNIDQLEREIQVLRRISGDAKLKNCLFLPRLHGVVTSKGQVIGMLINYIDGENLDDTDISKIAHSQRQRWKQQIERAIQTLHKQGVIWGDAKPGNILVDQQSNVHLIDFGGSYTEGWVDERLAGTKEGDLQGLGRIIDYLQLRRS